MRVNTSEWERSNWGKTPKGMGDWMFRIHGAQIRIHGTFTEAVKVAKKIASDTGANEITVEA